MRATITYLALATVGFVAAPAVLGSVPDQLPAQAKLVRNVAVPIPREIFASLDQFPNSNWRAVQRPELALWKPHGDQPQIALQLGVLIAEGFIAVEAKDAGEVKDLGRTVRSAARALGVEKAVLRRGQSIIESAEKNDWPATRHEWDSVLNDLESGMLRINGEGLAQYVSLGGWLRGTEALSTLVLQNYSPERAELLREPALLDHFQAQLSTPGATRRKSAAPAEMQAGLLKVREQLGNAGAPMTEDAVGKIKAVATELIAWVGARHQPSR